MRYGSTCGLFGFFTAKALSLKRFGAVTEGGIQVIQGLADGGQLCTYIAHVGQAARCSVFSLGSNHRQQFFASVDQGVFSAWGDDG